MFHDLKTFQSIECLPLVISSVDVVNSIGDWRMDIHGTFAKELESRGVCSIYPDHTCCPSVCLSVCVSVFLC